MSPAKPHVIDVTTDRFEADVLKASLTTPVLVDFWASWCGPCRTLGPVLEKIAGEYNGAFTLAKVDTEAEPQVAAAFQIRSIPTVYLVKDGQLVDGFQGALPDGQVREFLRHHGIEPKAPEAEPEPASPPARDAHADVVRLRAELAGAPDSDTLKLDLALALLETGAVAEAERLLEGLPANLATDDRSVRARARLGFLSLLRDAPPADVLRTAIAANPDDLRARHLLGVRELLEGQPEAGLDQFIEMLARDRAFDDGLPRKALVDAFRIVDDSALVGRYRRKMSALLF